MWRCLWPCLCITPMELTTVSSPVEVCKTTSPIGTGKTVPMEVPKIIPLETTSDATTQTETILNQNVFSDLVLVDEDGFEKI